MQWQMLPTDEPNNRTEVLKIPGGAIWRCTIYNGMRRVATSITFAPDPPRPVNVNIDTSKAKIRPVPPPESSGPESRSRLDEGVALRKPPYPSRPEQPKPSIRQDGGPPIRQGGALAASHWMVACFSLLLGFAIGVVMSISTSASAGADGGWERAVQEIAQQQRHQTRALQDLARSVDRL